MSLSEVFEMISYLITFHSNSGHIHRTVLLGDNLEGVKSQIMDATISNENELNHFESYGNKHILFSINYSNITCIEYEELGAEPLLPFDKMNNLSVDTLTIVLDHFKNDLMLGIALVHSEKEFVSKFTSCLSDNRKKIVKDIIKLELGKIKMNDVIHAQGEVIDVLSKLHEDGIVNIDFTS